MGTSQLLPDKGAKNLTRKISTRIRTSEPHTYYCGLKSLNILP